MLIMAIQYIVFKSITTALYMSTSPMITAMNGRNQKAFCPNGSQLIAETPKAYVLSGNNPENTTEFKQIFYEFYKTLPNNTQMSVFLMLGWQSSLIGFKSDNSYGAFLVASYGEAPSSITGDRVSINQGTVNCFIDNTPI